MTIMDRRIGYELLGAILVILGLGLACVGRQSLYVRMAAGDIGQDRFHVPPAADANSGNAADISIEADKFQAVIDDVHDGVIYVNEKGEYGYLDKNAWQNNVDQINPQLPQLLVGLSPKEVHEKIREWMKKNTGKQKAIPKILLDNVEATYVPILDQDRKYRGFVEVSKDVGEKLRLEQQIHRSERLAIVGELAAGVAHEINNPLDGLQNSVRLLRKNPDNKEQLTLLLPMMSEALDRIEFIVKKLLTFSRKQPLEKQLVSISHLISDSLDFVAHRLQRHNIKLNYEAPDPSLIICADSRQISQAILNIVLNAIDSMENAGELTITVKDSDFEEDMVEISVTDTGCGIPPQILPRIFDPFYTTKKEGHGTGLGLSVTQNIVKEHGGDIEVSSTVGIGSTFTIRLPRKAPEKDCEITIFQ